MFVPLPCLINSFSSFMLIIYQSSATHPECFLPFNNKKLPSVKPKLKSAISVD